MRWGGGGVKVFQGLFLQSKTTKENQVKNRNVEGKNECLVNVVLFWM
jgi:hypothetical protein